MTHHRYYSLYRAMCCFDAVAVLWTSTAISIREQCTPCNLFTHTVESFIFQLIICDIVSTDKSGMCVFKDRANLSNGLTSFLTPIYYYYYYYYTFYVQGRHQCRECTTTPPSSTATRRQAQR